MLRPEANILRRLYSTADSYSIDNYGSQFYTSTRLRTQTLHQFNSVSLLASNTSELIQLFYYRWSYREYRLEDFVKPLVELARPRKQYYLSITVPIRTCYSGSRYSGSRRPMW